MMEVAIEQRASVRKLRTRIPNKVRVQMKLDDRERARRMTEDVIAQRLFSIILAAHAAETSLEKDPARLEAILELIRTQSAASLEDLRQLSALR
ncbi:MAG: histidine kinase [Nitrososphaerales archaeon]